MAVKNIFPNTLGCNGMDGNRRHAEATEQAQAAWDRTLAANARNEREADARRRSINTPDEVASRGCVFAKSCTLPEGTINHIKNKLRNGKAPFAQRPEHNGENARYEIHHIENVQHGGAVYDVDNLAIMTPKRHVAIHKEDRQ